MVLPSVAFLAYSTPLGGPVADTTKQARMSVVQLYNPTALPCTTDPVLGPVFGCSVIGDVTAPSGGSMIRTIELALNAQFFVNFPSQFEWAAALASLYDRTLALALSAPVSALPVTFA